MMPRTTTTTVLAFSVAAAAACGAALQTTQPAQEMAQRAKPPGSVYTGWRVFQDKCARCHGADAAGTTSAPDLRLRVRDMGPRRFVNLVMLRYEWEGSLSRGSGERDVRVDEIMQRRDAPLSMPAWEGEPRVTAHIIDLYEYLSARAEGSQGPGRPSP